MTVPTLKFPINLLSDGSVISKYGEYLGTWDTDETDAFYQFTPYGATDPIFSDSFKGSLCTSIHEWHASKA